MSLFDRVSPGSASWVAIPSGGGLDIEAFVHRGRDPGPRVAVVAGIHGDEFEGTAAAHDLVRHLTPEVVRGAVALIPVANPMAFASATRTTPEDGMNLARTFPGDLAGSSTERLASALFAALGDTEFLIDLHSGGVACEFWPVAGFYGPASTANPSFAAAFRFGLPALWNLPPTPGVLSRELAVRGTTAVGCEYRGGGRLDPEGREAYRVGVSNCLRGWGVLPATADVTPRPPAFSGDWILAEATGLFERLVRLGDVVATGAEVARIVGVRGEVVQTIVADRGGTILGLRSLASIRPGDWAVLMGQAQEIDDE